jgi:cbb3-type cytochrome oxidase subunit 3
MQNVVLLIINSVGVWRYLLSPSRKEAAGPVEQAPAA